MKKIDFYPLISLLLIAIWVLFDKRLCGLTGFPFLLFGIILGLPFGFLEPDKIKSKTLIIRFIYSLIVITIIIVLTYFVSYSKLEKYETKLGWFILLYFNGVLIGRKTVLIINSLE